jgi:hypothetical protein
MAARHDGNMPVYSINQVDGTDIFVKNTRVFSSGSDAYSITYATDQDKQTALLSAQSTDALVIYRINDTHFADSDASFSVDVAAGAKCNRISA